MSIEQRAQVWQQILADGEDAWVAEEGGRIVGWISAAASRDADARPFTGEIWAVYVAPDHWRSGIGRLLCADAEQRLATQGMVEVTLWLLRDNERALRFYQSMGFAVDPGAEKTITRAGAELREIRMRKKLG